MSDEISQVIEIISSNFFVNVFSVGIFTLLSKVVIEYTWRKDAIREKVKVEEAEEFEEVISSEDLKAIKKYYGEKFGKLRAVDVLANPILKERIYLISEKLAPYVN